MSEPLQMVGVVGSPYSRKLRALLRYRRIPYLWHSPGTPEQQALPPPPLPLLPQLVFPKAGRLENTSDTTFQLRRLEREYRGRSAVPSDSALAFIDLLIEDYADEWVTKMMYHYRWAVDAENASRILPRWNLAVPEKFAEAFPAGFGQRQIDRLALIGSNPTTGPVIEANYRELLETLEQHFRTHRFLMGGRPGTCDFALHGQLTQLVQVEPTPQALAREIAPRVVTWCDVMEDLSGISVDEKVWVSRNALPDTFRRLLDAIGRSYVPFLLANAEALASGADRVECSVAGAAWTQPPFKYQGKCLEWLRAAYAELTPADREAVDGILAGTGCERLLV